jgi:hypothetical protein
MAMVQRRTMRTRGLGEVRGGASSNGGFID